MHTKLFSRIAVSSLMEEPIDVRYTFVFMLAICDTSGHVAGTDLAIARRLNMSVADFQRCVAALMAPDPDSNSKEEDGRRVIKAGNGPGYKLVNYLLHQADEGAGNRRDYMANYMRQYREKRALKCNFHYTYEIREGEFFYIGVRSCHVSPEQDTGYMGSGTWCQHTNNRSRAKSILAVYESREEADRAERELIFAHCGNPNCMNVRKPAVVEN